MRFRFVHAADLHLDTPFAGVGLTDPSLAARLRDASLDAFDRVVAQALAVEAAFVVFAGDLYDGVERGVRAQLRFRAGLDRLAARGVAAFIAHGNHDPLGGRWSAIARWPEGVTLFPAREPLSVPVIRDGHTLALVHGVSYGARAETDNLALRFPRARGEAGALEIGVLHASVDGQPGHAPYAPCSLADLRSRGYGYWALGHVHRQLVLARDPWVVYPGNTQGRSFAPGELGPKGAVVVHVEDGAVARVEPFATDAARFFELTADVSGADELHALGAQLLRGAEALAVAHGGVELLVRASVTGRGPLHRVLRAPASAAELLAHLRDQAPARLHWLELAVATAPSLDLERLAQGGDLRAAVLATRAAWSAGDPRATWPEPLRRALDEVGAPPAAQWAELLEAAALDVLDRLAPGEGA